MVPVRQVAARREAGRRGHTTQGSRRLVVPGTMAKCTPVPGTNLCCRERLAPRPGTMVLGSFSVRSRPPTHYTTTDRSDERGLALVLNVKC